MDWDKHELARRAEQASLERWFGRGPQGHLFFAADGRAWPLRPEEVRQWRDMGANLIDSRLLEMKADVPRDVLIGFGCAILAWWVLWPILPQALAATLITAGGLGWPSWRAWEFRSELRDFRSHIEGQMAGRRVIDAATAAQWQIKNPYRTALYIMLAALGVGSVLAPVLPIIEIVPAPLWIAFPVAAWALWFAAEHSDNQQRGD